MKCAKCKEYFDDEIPCIFVRFGELYLLCYNCGFEIMDLIKAWEEVVEDDAN